MKCKITKNSEETTSNKHTKKQKINTKMKRKFKNERHTHWLLKLFSRQIGLQMKYHFSVQTCLM